MGGLKKIKLERSAYSRLWIIIFVSFLTFMAVNYFYIQNKDYIMLTLALLLNLSFLFFSFMDSIFICKNYLFITFFPFFLFRRVALSDIIVLEKVAPWKAISHFKYANSAYSIVFKRRFFKNKIFTFVTQEDLSIYL